MAKKLSKDEIGCICKAKAVLAGHFSCYNDGAMRNLKRLVLAASFTVFVFGFAGWIYIAGNAVFHPQTLSLPLTHLASFPHEDTFGALCFVLSFIALFVYRFLTD